MTKTHQPASQGPATVIDDAGVQVTLPAMLPLPGIQHLIIGPRLPWIDESKMDGHRPEQDFAVTGG